MTERLGAAGRLLRPRGVIALASAAVALLAATGFVQSEAFHEASNLKYSITILGPLLILTAALSRHPLRVVMLPAIVVAPFASATVGLAEMRVGLLAPFLVAGALIAPLASVQRGRMSSLAPAGLLAFPLLLLPLANGTDVGSYVAALALLLALAWLVSIVAREPGGMAAVLTAITVGAVIQSLIALWQARTGHLLNLYGTAGSQQYASNYFYSYGSTKRPGGSLPDPISLGNVLAISLPCTIMLAVQAQRRSRRLLMSIAALLIAAALILTLSRESWIGGFAGSIVAIALLPHGMRMRVVKHLALGAAVIAVAAGVAEGPAVMGRLSSIGDPTSTQGVSAAQVGVAIGDQHRLQYWHVAVVDAFGGNPLTGVGIGNLGDFMRDRVLTAGAGIRSGTAIFLHAHSTYFQMLGEAGLFGAVLLLLAVSGLLRDALRSRGAEPILGPGLAGSAVALLICWVTDWVIHNEPVAACVGIMLGAIAAGGRLARVAAVRDSG